jgi:2Fe-2S ferredoxin
MITLHFLIRQPDGGALDKAVSGRPGDSLMQAASAAGIDGIAADCGGVLTCATCHVYVSQAWSAKLAPPIADESSMLEFVAAERRTGSRLSCQITLSEALDGLTVELPESQY